MIKWLIWTIWTLMSSVLKKADKLNLSLSLVELSTTRSCNQCLLDIWTCVSVSNWTKTRSRNQCLLDIWTCVSVSNWTVMWSMPVPFVDLRQECVSVSNWNTFQTQVHRSSSQWSRLRDLMVGSLTCSPGHLVQEGPETQYFISLVAGKSYCHINNIIFLYICTIDVSSII